MPRFERGSPNLARRAAFWRGAPGRELVMAGSCGSDPDFSAPGRGAYRAGPRPAPFPTTQHDAPRVVGGGGQKDEAVVKRRGGGDPSGGSTAGGARDVRRVNTSPRPAATSGPLRLQTAGGWRRGWGKRVLLRVRARSLARPAPLLRWWVCRAAGGPPPSSKGSRAPVEGREAPASRSDVFPTRLETLGFTCAAGYVRVCLPGRSGKGGEERGAPSFLPAGSEGMK